MSTNPSFDDELNRLTIHELRRIAANRIPQASVLRKGDLIEAMCNRLPPAELQAAVQSALRVPSSQIASPRKRRHSRGPSNSTAPPPKKRYPTPSYTHAEFAPERADFLVLPTDEEYDECIRGYRARTSNEALRSTVCMVCAREVFARDTRDLRVDSLPNRHRLKPEQPHRDWRLIQQLGLHNPAVRGGDGEERGDVCDECRHSLERDSLPWCALANNMWIGEVPFQLRVLTRPEKLLVALYFPTAFIYKLYPKSNRFDPSTLQTGYRGNVSTYRLDTQEIASFMGAKRLPHKPEILASTIAVTFVGPRNRPERSMRGLFLVRRQRVLEALVWLKEHNPLYRRIEIDSEALSGLPDNDVPQSISSNVQYDPQGSPADNDTSYVPDVDGDEDQDQRMSEAGCGLEDSSDEVDDELDPEIIEDAKEDVIPLQQMGVVDSNTTSISSSDLLRSAIANLSESQLDEGIAVRRGNEFVSEWARRDPESGKLSDGGPDNPNHLLGAFPWLFPHGAGGFEVDRPRKVSYNRHGAWTMDYGDKRFRREHAFIAQVFGVLHKRQVLASASVQVKRAAYERNEVAISRLRLEDFKEAVASKGWNHRSLNPAVAALQRQVYATSARVMGSDASRKSIRRRIYGITAMEGPAFVWATINPCDVDDPICQVFAGEEVDMDRFLRELGPDAKKRRQNVAEDPYAAAKYFHFIVTVLLEEIFGITATPIQTIFRKRGILGKVKAYVGVVESQGRGTLHLHILFWLMGMPTGQEMKEMLLSEEFRDQVKAFIEKNIRAHVDGLDAQLYQSKDKLQSHAAWSRVPDPTKTKEMMQREFDVVAVSQRHDCGPGCQRRFKGQVVCKRRAPFQLAEEAFVKETGEWGPKRTFALMNAWCPAISRCTGANNDMKILLCGAAILALAFYISDYMTKKQVNSTNAGALIARRLAYHQAEEAQNTDIRERNRRLIFKCLNTLAREHEMSAPELVSHLKGWGDRYYSHTFVMVMWAEMLHALKQAFPELHHRKANQVQGAHTQENENDENDDHNFDVRLSISRNYGVSVRSQVEDYSLRAPSLSHFGLLFFLLRTYETKISGGGNEANREDEHGNRSERHNYLADHPRTNTQTRIIRKLNHEIMPEFIGPWFPRRDDPATQELYWASMLMLFKPWRDLSELKVTSWRETFLQYVSGCSKKERDIMDNIQWYYETQDAVEEDRKRDTRSRVGAGFEEDEDLETFESDPAQLAEGFEGGETEEEEVPDRRGCSLSEWMNGEEAIRIGESVGILDAPTTWKSSLSEASSIANDGEVACWKAGVDHIAQVDPYAEGDLDLENIWIARPAGPSVEIKGPDVELQGPLLDELTVEQKRAFGIIDDHLRDNLAGRQPKQLLMLVMGEAGTGKSKLIKAITWAFGQRGVSHLLAKAGMTGVAANLIGGTTLHHFAVLPPIHPTSSKNREPSDKTKRRREQHIRPKRYLILDECSMMDQETLAETSSSTSGALTGLDGWIATAPFGGLLNGIFFGDFHQFPPVRHAQSALYKPVRASNSYAHVGRGIFEQFDQVVLLTEQKRVPANSEWAQLLRRARFGSCSESDILKMEGMVLAGRECPSTDAGDWVDTVLVTPRNAVRIQWNEKAVRAWCSKNEKPLFVLPSVDTVGRERRPLSLAERRLLTNRKEEDTGDLSSKLELAEGMRVIVTVRHEKMQCLSKGATGVIRRILLSEGDSDVDVSTGVIHLTELPKAIIVALDCPPEGVVEGLAPGEVPIFPLVARFRIRPFKQQPNQTVTVTRHQYGISPAFAFTDYKAQGQTIGRVRIDLAQPGKGGLNQFNAYVAITRGTGEETLRFLRDFDTSLFTGGIDPDLAVEDARLRELNLKTKRVYELRHGVPKPLITNRIA